MIRAVIVLVAALLGLTRNAQADDFPARKPGLWEVTMNLGQSRPRVIRYCIDAATDAQLRDMGQNMVDGRCSRREFHRIGNILTSDSVCKIGTSEVTSHSVTTFADDTSYATVVTSHYDPPSSLGHSDTKTTQDAKWIGPCEPDLQPGDMIVQGRKMHIPTAPR